MDQNDPGFPLADFLSMRIERLEPGHARAVLEANEVHHNPHGFLHGAVLFTMVDTAMGAATMSLLPEGQRCTTIEIQLRFLRPVVEGALAADTTARRAPRVEGDRRRRPSRGGRHRQLRRRRRPGGLITRRRSARCPGDVRHCPGPGRLPRLTPWRRHRSA
jgi:uncharacterized protein (TIGR00369 family)